MKISIDTKRVILTTFTCFSAAIITQYFSTTETFYAYSVPLLFSVAIPLTSIDKIITKKKYHAFLLSTLLTSILFFFSIGLTFFLSNSFLGLYSFYIICIVSGLLTLLINSIFIQIENIRLGVLVTGLLAISIFPLTTYLRGHSVLGISFFNDPASFFTVWQTIIGFAIALTIWAKIPKTANS